MILAAVCWSVRIWVWNQFITISAENTITLSLICDKSPVPGLLQTQLIIIMFDDLQSSEVEWFLRYKYFLISAGLIQSSVLRLAFCVLLSHYHKKDVSPSQSLVVTSISCLMTCETLWISILKWDTHERCKTARQHFVSTPCWLWTLCEWSGKCENNVQGKETSPTVTSAQPGESPVVLWDKDDCGK